MVATAIAKELHVPAKDKTGSLSKSPEDSRS